jgi:4-amino-4-deoxy-L-arabinose transferase-like glycosyltransferase
MKRGKFSQKAGQQMGAALEVTIAERPFSDRVEILLARRATLLVLALVVFGSLRIVATYPVFNHTCDEPAHIACGMEWLDHGTYRLEPQHPPLTRVMVALGPYLAGARSDSILYGRNADGKYDLRLALARAGNLPFFWLACWMVFLWGSRILGPAGGVVAVLMFTMIPTTLAHAGLATTDMGVTACFTAAVYASFQLAERPGLKSAIWLGAALGLMVLSKFSALVFYPAAIVAVIACWACSVRPAVRELGRLASSRLPWTALAALFSLLIIWAGYRFSFGKSAWFSFPVPFPELYAGIQQVIDHNASGHLSYFLGELRMDGWWTFFPILTMVKLPLAFLALLAFGLWLGNSKAGGPAKAWPFAMAWAVPSAIYAVALLSRINIGMRHILPAFPFLAIIAAGGSLGLLRKGNRMTGAPWIAFAVLAWLCINSLAAHPDYLAYFNAIAGREPERIVVDSDLDWGQDIKRLGKRLRELRAPSVSFTPTIGISLAALGFPPNQQNQPDSPAPGWNAVEVLQWKRNRMGLSWREQDQRTWPDFFKPTERVGKSILLYYVPPRAGR